MAGISHTPVKQAISRVRALSADAEAQRLASVRERALHDEATLLSDAHRKGLQEGMQKGRSEGLEEGLQKVARALIQADLLSDEEIAQMSTLPLSLVQQMRKQQLP